MPTSKGEAQMIFMRMLKKCKFTKFCEINFKILTCILVTPKILSCIKKTPSISKCAYCGSDAGIDHILLACEETNKVRQTIVGNNRKLLEKWGMREWIYGPAEIQLNLIVWLFNFAIYKSHLEALEGYRDNLALLVQNVFYTYLWYFAMISNLNCTIL